MRCGRWRGRGAVLIRQRPVGLLPSIGSRHPLLAGGSCSTVLSSCLPLNRNKLWQADNDDGAGCVGDPHAWSEVVRVVRLVQDPKSTKPTPSTPSPSFARHTRPPPWAPATPFPSATRTRRWWGVTRSGRTCPGRGPRPWGVGIAPQPPPAPTAAPHPAPRSPRRLLERTPRWRWCKLCSGGSMGGPR